MCGVIVCFRLANLFYSSIDIMPELKLAKRKTASLVSDLVRPFVLPFVCLSVRPPVCLSVRVYNIDDMSVRIDFGLNLCFPAWLLPCCM